MNRWRAPASGLLPEAIAPLMLVVSAAVFGGCGNLTAGGGTAEITVAMSGDAPDSQGGPDRVLVVRAAEPSAASGRDEPEGEVEAEFTLFLESSDGSQVALAETPVRLRLDLEGRQELDAVTATVPADRYVALHVVFTDFEVEVDAGLIVNGVPIVGRVEVELEDGTLPVRRPISLDVADGERVELLVDLNAATWLQAVDPDLRKVAESVVGSAIAVTVR